MNAKQFLIFGGLALLIVGILGFAGIIGPTAEKSLFGQAWYFDNVENVAHAAIGIAALALVLLKLDALYRPATFAIGLAALFFALLNLFLGGHHPNIGSANLESPTDLILHLAVSAWALMSWWKSGRVPSIAVTEVNDQK